MLRICSVLFGVLRWGHFTMGFVGHICVVIVRVGIDAFVLLWA